MGGGVVVAAGGGDKGGGGGCCRRRMKGRMFGGEGGCCCWENNSLGSAVALDRNPHVHASARRLLRNASMHIWSRAWRFSWVFNVATQLAPKLYFGIPMCLPG